MHWARNTMPYHNDDVFTTEELGDYIEDLLKQGDLKAVKTLIHVLSAMSDNDTVIISSC